VAMVDILMICWHRLVDTDNLYQIRVHLTPPEPKEEELSAFGILVGEAAKKIEELLPPPNEWDRAMRRLGAFNMFNPMHPEGPWKLDVSLPDDRKVALALIQLAIKEEGPKGTKDTLLDFNFTPAKGKKITKLPETWPPEMPKEGVWELTYNTQEEFNSSEGVMKWVAWPLRVAITENLKSWKKMRKPLPPIAPLNRTQTVPNLSNGAAAGELDLNRTASEIQDSTKPAKPPPAPVAWQYHLDSYRAQKAFFAEKAAEEAEEAALKVLEESPPVKPPTPPPPPPNAEEMISGVDITSVSHAL